MFVRGFILSETQGENVRFRIILFYYQEDKSAFLSNCFLSKYTTIKNSFI